MVYDPQQQRPEEQALNNNRESLNIRQPGEAGSTGFDWEQVRKAREAAGRKSVVPDPSIGVGDMARAVGSAPLDMARDSAQLFHAGSEILERKGNEYKSGENQPLLNVDVDPALLQVMRENRGNPLSESASAIIGSAGKLAGKASDAIQSGYSEDAKLAASMKPFEFDKDKGVTVMVMIRRSLLSSVRTSTE